MQIGNITSAASALTGAKGAAAASASSGAAGLFALLLGQQQAVATGEAAALAPAEAAAEVVAEAESTAPTAGETGGDAVVASMAVADLAAAVVAFTPVEPANVETAEQLETESVDFEELKDALLKPLLGEDESEKEHSQQVAERTAVSTGAQASVTATTAAKPSSETAVTPERAAASSAMSPGSGTASRGNGSDVVQSPATPVAAAADTAPPRVLLSKTSVTTAPVALDAGASQPTTAASGHAESMAPESYAPPEVRTSSAGPQAKAATETLPAETRILSQAPAGTGNPPLWVRSDAKDAPVMEPVAPKLSEAPKGTGPAVVAETPVKGATSKTPETIQPTVAVYETTAAATPAKDASATSPSQPSDVPQAEPLAVPATIAAVQPESEQLADTVRHARQDPTAALDTQRAAVVFEEKTPVRSSGQVVRVPEEEVVTSAEEVPDDAAQSDVVKQAAKPEPKEAAVPRQTEPTTSKPLEAVETGSAENAPARSTNTQTASNDSSGKDNSDQKEAKRDDSAIVGDSTPTDSAVVSDKPSSQASPVADTVRNAVTPASQGRPDAVAVPRDTGTVPAQAVHPDVAARNQASHALGAGSTNESAPRTSSVESYLHDSAVKSVRYAVSQGEHSLKVRLSPATLGDLVVEVTSGKDGLQVRLGATHPGVRDALEGQIQGLKDSLARDGVDVARITVSVEPTGHTAGFGSMPQRQPGHETAYERPTPSFTGGGAYQKGASSTATPRPTRRANGGLDLYA